MAKKQLKDYKFVPGAIPPAYGQYPNAVSLITSNKEYLIAEIMGFLSAKTSTPAYHVSPGNKTTYAQALLVANKEFIKEEANAWIISKVQAGTVPFNGYVYNATKQAKCKRDIGYLIDAFVADLEGGGNFETLRIGRMFYLGGVAQLLNPVQEAAVHTFVKTLITDNVLVNLPFTSLQLVASQSILANDGEAGTSAKLATLNNTIINIITNGLVGLPAVSYNFDEAWARIVYKSSKCKRDLAYILTGAGFDLALQTNYNSIFLGKAESNSLDYDQLVIDTINASKAQVLALPAVSGDAGSVTAVNTYYSNLLTVAGGGAGSTISFTNPSGQTTSLIAAKDKLVANKAFIQAEINAWVATTYPAHNHSEAKCARDIGYAVDGFCYDMLYGGNSATYDSAKFFYYSGAANITAEHLAQTVAAYGRLRIIVGQIVQGQSVTKTTTGSTPNTLTQDTSGNNASNGDSTTLQALAQIVADVVNAGIAALPATRTAPDVTWSTTALKASKTAIDTASTTIQNTVVNYNDYTYNSAKCERDSEYVLDSYIYDLTYGGNSMSYYVASRYQIGGVAQVYEPLVEDLTQTFARDLINEYILINKYHPSYQYTVDQTVNSSAGEAGSTAKITILSNIIINTIETGLTALPTVVAPDSQLGGLLPNTVTLLEANKRFIQAEVIAYIAYNVANNIVPFVFYTYNQAKCERDVSYVLDGYISDLKHGGNRQTVFNAGKYWEGGVAQVDGNRLPEASAHTFIRDLIDNFILDKVPFTAYQTAVVQVTTGPTAEAPAKTRVKELTNTILDLILYGLDYLPSVVSNRGYIKVPGYYKLRDFLLVTNTTQNIILYNFADPLSAGEVTYTETLDTDFPAALYGVDKITTITFDTDTRGMMITDNIQVFVEAPQQEVIMNRAGRDAMERMKVGIPQSMLDADFEYGLQPTKWQAISLMRNYPAVYEIPGSDIAVVNVVTDASSGTSGAGASLITVTTVSSHGYAVGDPFTIKALANTISGFSRAEGSFLVNTVTSTTVFTYYAKSKVGSSNGQVLATNYTQLRKAGFYTNANIGSPTFSVYSSGSNGNVTTSLITPSGSDVVGFTGSPPPIGSPLSGTGITLGTQVTAVAGGGGTVASTQLAVKGQISDTTISVVSTTGISSGLVFDRGDGQAVVVTNVSGQDISLSGPLTSTIIGNAESYTGLTQTATSGTGSGAIISVSRSGATYTTTVTNPGNGYISNDTITIAGTGLGGTAPTNTATITVTNATALNSIATLNNSTGTGGSGYGDSTGATTTVSPSGGTGCTVDILTTGGVINSILLNNPGTGYSIGDTLTIAGGTGGTIQVATINAGGLITGVSTTGTPITAPTKNFISAFTMSDITTAQIASGSTGIAFSSIATIQVTFASNHGFVPGDTITVQIISAGTGAQLAAGAYFVEQTPTTSTFLYTARAAGTVDNTLAGNVYARPDSFFVHRPFDGGVQLGTASPSHGASAIRMSKKYIRYQSGKGVMYNTGALFAPSYDLRGLTATGTAIGSTITITTDDTDHGCQVGGAISISGVKTSGYDGEYVVTDIVTERILKVAAQKLLGATTAVIGSPCLMSVRKWHGSTIRSGIFDDQNGMFWQYDGIRMAVCRRSSTFQITGTISIASNSNLVTGSNTRFASQLAQGDRIVIRGMTHVISQVQSNTIMTVTPDFRGVVDVSGAKCTKTIDLLIPQEQFNLDPLNGSGASGYNIDVTKMQMIGIQHTWYGAGFIDFMLRGPEGNYTWAHRFRNSNVNTEAYMRTGNQPVRYEVINEGAKGRLTAAMDNSQTTITMSEYDTFWFPDSATVLIDNELIRYTGRTTTQLTGCTRAAGLTQFVAGSQRTFTAGSAATHVVNAGVILVSNTITPNISHWGSAFMIDGQFDSDRGYIFNYAATAINVSVDKVTAFLIRLAPSVSNAQIGDLGEKELLNRAQLLLSGISITSDAVASGGGAIVVEGVLNPVNYPTDPTKITWTGLASSAAGGQPSFAQIAAGGSVSWTGSNYTTTATVQGAFTSTITAKSFNLITANITATAFSAITQNFVIRSFSAATSSTYNNALSSTRNDFLIAQSDLTTLNTSTTLTTGDTLSILGNGSTLSGVRITGVSGTISFTNPGFALYVGEYLTVTGTFTNPAFSLNNVQITGLTGQFSCNAASQTIYTGQVITIQNAITGGGTIGGYTVGPTQYLISVTNGSTSFTLTTLGGATVSTSIGNGSGASYTIAAPSIVGYTSGTQYRIAATNGTTTATLTTTVGGGLTTTGGVPTGIATTVTAFFTTATVSTVTPNYITLNSTAYARVVLLANPFISSGAAVTDEQFNVTVRVASSLSTQYNTAISNARTDFLIPQTQAASTTISPADVLSTTTFLVGGQTVASITQNYCFINSTAYARVLMTAAGSATSTAGTGNPVSVTITNSVSNTYNRAFNTNRSDFLITDTEFDSSGILASDGLSATTYVTGGQVIQSVSRTYLNIGGTNYTRVVMNGAPNVSSVVNAGNDVVTTVTASGTASSYVKTNFLYFTAGSWTASGATQGTKVATSYTQFPAGSAVTTITTRVLGGTTIYRVVFTQTANTTIAAASTVTFQFGALYALPGEQVFSFVSNPGSTDTLPLEALKELTATAIGGRGTFPNGPDVLAINVYKVAGTATTANLILRWGEAQA
jgi:hypothetical protein